jgi:chromosome segregation ATPase|tara:strand:+ start:1172 stop:1861 length:690 start_codon:yes stop_codon:yes gene_type:complete
MSLKEHIARFEESLGESSIINSTFEKEQIEDKEQIIEKLEEETHNLSNQVFNLESEKNNILQELNKARYFEEGVFSIKEKDYINEIKSKENIIKEIKSEFNPLYKKIDEQKVKLSYKNDIIKKYTNINKELHEKINKLNYRLNSENENSKEIIGEIKLERKRTYQDYVNNLDAYENTITSKNEMINNYKTKLEESLDKLKEANNLIINLKKDIKINENVRQELREKNER